MCRSTRFLAAAAIAIGGISFSVQVFAQQPDAGNRAGSSTGSAGSSGAGSSEPQAGGAIGEADADAGRVGGQARRQEDVKGVQDLFAQTTDAALAERGISQLEGLFTRERVGARERGAPGNAEPGATGHQSGSNQIPGHVGTDGASGTAESGNGRAGTSGSASSSARSGASNAGANAGGGIDARGTVASGPELQKLEELRGQIRTDWQNKYHQPFQITKPMLVFSDITAADIGTNAPRPAAGELRGNRSEQTPGASKDSSGANAGSSSATPRERQNAAGAQSGELNAGREANAEVGSARHAGHHQIGMPVTVNVPAIRGTEALQVDVVREGAHAFQFATREPVDVKALTQNLEKHLRQVQQSQKDWPRDVNQAYRLVTQHVLMAISDTTGTASKHAQPAGERIRGNRNHSDSGANPESIPDRIGSGIDRGAPDAAGGSQTR